MSTELDFDFDRMSKLHKSSPEEFEAIRTQLIEQALAQASKKSQQRLRGLQFQIDAKREVNKDKPYVACMEVTKMMHESFEKLRVHLNELAGNKDSRIHRTVALAEHADANDYLDTPAQSADILSFNR